MAKKDKIKINFIENDYGMVIAEWGYYKYRKFYRGDDIYVSDVKDPSFWGTYTYTHGGIIYKKVCKYIADLKDIKVGAEIKVLL